MKLLTVRKELNCPTNFCCECGGPIYESMGTTLAGDFVKAVNGEIPRYKIRQGCPRCANRWIIVREKVEHPELFK